MFDVLIIFLIFYLLQLMLPMLLSIKSVPFSDFAGVRDKSIDLSIYSQRADRSVRNFRESLPVVLMLIALSIALDIDNSQTVMYFIYTRIVYRWSPQQPDSKPWSRFHRHRQTPSWTGWCRQIQKVW